MKTPDQLNILSILDLVASDAAYRTLNAYNADRLVSGNPIFLQSMPDSSTIVDEQGVPDSLFAGLPNDSSDLFARKLVFRNGTREGGPAQTVTFTNWELIKKFQDDRDGFGAAIFKSTVQVDGKYQFIVAFQGSDGLDPKDWFADLDLARTTWQRNGAQVVEFLVNGGIGDDGNTYSGDLRPSVGVVNFTGQSLGGGLAQYGAYFFASRLAASGQAATLPERMSLIDFNAFGAVAGINNLEQGNYKTSLLANVPTIHYAIENDVVHRLGTGDPRDLARVGGSWHVSGIGNSYTFKFARFEGGAPASGRNLLNPVDAHRIESGFYRGLTNYGGDFSSAFNTPLLERASYAYIDTHLIQSVGSRLSRIFSDGASTNLSAAGRTAIGVLGGATLGPISDYEELKHALVDSLYRSGTIDNAGRIALSVGGSAITIKTVVNAAANLAIKGLGPVAWGISIGMELFKGLSAREKQTAIALENSLLPEDRQGLQYQSLDDPQASSGDWALRYMTMSEYGAQFGAPEDQQAVLKSPDDQRFVDDLLRVNTNVDEFGAALESGPEWARDALGYLQRKAIESNETGMQWAAFDADALRFFNREAVQIQGVDAGAATRLQVALVEFAKTDVGQALANASSDFTDKHPLNKPSAFEGRSFDFVEYRRYRDALAAIAVSPEFTAIQPVLRQAQMEIDAAGERPVVEVFGSKPTNPFDDSAFDPDRTGFVASEIEDGGAATYSVFLPYRAGEDGQHIKLQLTGADADKFSVVGNGEAIPVANGAFTLAVPEGRRQTSFALVAPQDFQASGSVSIDATLVDASGEATHRTHHEADLAIEHDDAPFGKVVSGPFDTYPLGTRDVPPGSGFARDPQTNQLNNPGLVHTRLVGTADAEMIFSDHASELVEAGDGANYIFAGSHVGPASDPFRGADVIRSGTGNDLVLGDLGASRIAVGEGNNLVKPYDGPQFTIRGVLPDGSLFNGLSIDSVAHFYADFGASLKVEDIGDEPVLDAQGNLALPIQVVFDSNGLSGNSQYFNFQPDSQADNGFPFIRRDPGGGSPYALSANADGSAMLTYSAGDRAAVFRIDIRNDAAPNALSPRALEPMSIEAGAGADFLFGGEGRDVIRAGAGDDRIAGGGDDDTLLAESGEDRIVSGPGDDYVDAGAGADKAWGEAGDDALLGGAGADELFGGDGRDYLDGGADNDRLFGDAGADELYGGEGNDLLAGGGADDRLYGELGDDNLQGDAGADLLKGGLGRDVLSGGEGDDVLDGGGGDDRLAGDGGNDQLSGAAGNDALDGGDGYDTLAGGEGDDTLLGGAGEDLLDAGLGNDVLTGGEGNDTYIYRAGDGLDEITDLAGNDRLELVGIAPADVQLLPGSLFISLGAGQGIHIEGFDPAHALESAAIERFTFAATGDTLSLAELLDNLGITLLATPGANVIQGTSARDNIDALAGDDVVYGNGGNDRVAGGDGNDELHGGEGDDVLDGGTGADLMIGGEGGDSYFVDDAADVIDEAPAGGADVVYAARSYALGPNLEDLQLTGFADIEGTGNDADNQIVGNDGANRLSGLGGDDRLDGGAGSDLMAGGAGDDQYVVDGSLDIIVELAGEGHDLVTSTDSYVLPDEVEDLILEGAFSQSGAVAALSGTGNALDNRIVGNDGDNVLDGRAGLDSIDGRAGNDVILGGDGDDQLFGGDDAIFSASDGGALRRILAPNADTISGGAGNDTINGGSGDGQLIGEAGDDFLFGGNDGLVAGGYGGYGGTYLSNDDLLDGGDGNDTLDGGSGDDRLLGGDGADALFGGADGYLNTSNNDYLDGGPGIDLMAGGTGNDVYIVDDSRDTVVEYLGQGYDVVHSSADFTLPDDVEELFLQEGSAARVARGNSADNVLHANSAGDRLEGGAGDDVLVGGAGDDILDGGVGSNVYDFGYGSGGDTIYSDPGAFDTVRIGLDLAPANVSLARDGDDLTLRIIGTADRLRVAGWYGGRSGVAALEFADGTIWDTVAIAEAANRHVLIAHSDTATVQEDLLLHAAGSVLDNDTGTGLIAPVSVLNPGSISGSHGTLGLAADGTYAYELINDAVQFLAEGQALHDVFAYRAEDAGGAKSSARIDITILGTNDAPVAVNDAAGVQEDVALSASGNVIANDRDADADTKLAVLTPGSFVGAYGTLKLAADGSYTYTLANGSSAVQQLRAGQTVSDVFGYAATDGIASAAGMFSANVAGSNDAPVLANPLANQSAQAGRIFSLALPANTFTDIDKDDVLSYSARRADGAALPAWLHFDAVTRTLSGTPAPTDAGSLQVRIAASDLAGVSADDLFSISVTGNRTFDFVVSGAWPRCDEGDDEHDRGRRKVGNEREHDGDEAKCPSHRANVGSPGRPGTGETVSIEGKNRTNGVYTGGAGADTLNGTSGPDALLLDDDLSARPSGGSGPRIISIETINMGEGDDVVDLTSTRFTYGDVAINGGAGNDLLWSGAGNDVLDGGAGDDSLAAGAGDDTYLHARGAGNDVIAETGGLDTIRFAAGIASNTVRVSRHGKDLVLADGANGSVTVKNWFGANTSRVERVQFADGTVWSEAQLSMRASASSSEADGRSALGGADGLRSGNSTSRAPESGEAHQASGSKDKVIDATDVIVALLAKRPSYDFSALDAYLSKQDDDSAGRRLTPAEIAQKWRSLQRFTAYLAETDPYAKEAAQGHGYSDDLLQVAAAAVNWGYEGSVGQARAAGGMSTLQGLTEGFSKLR